LKCAHLFENIVNQQRSALVNLTVVTKVQFIRTKT